MEKKIEQWLEKRAQDIKEEWRNGVENKITMCESPIEELFYLEWLYQTQEWSDYELIYIMPQYKINRYRVDFLIYTNIDENWMEKEFSYPEYNKEKSLVVEIDSYLWHGSTPEQFVKEKERERYLQKEGWVIYRYSGKEIYRNVEKCVEEVLDYMLDIETKMLEKNLEKIEENN